MADEASTSSLWPRLSGSDDQGPYLHATRCAQCAHVMLGRRGRCTACWQSERLEPLPVGRRGRVYSRTVIHAAAPGYVAPYSVGYVDLPEGIRVFAHLVSGEGTPAIGDEVQLEIVPLRTADATNLTGPRYRRFEGGER